MIFNWETTEANTMSFKNAQDLAASNAPDLSNTMRITKNYTDLRRSQTFLRKLADVFLNLITTHTTWIQ